jgi:hypothetical protein
MVCEVMALAVRHSGQGGMSAGGGLGLLETSGISKGYRLGLDVL